MNISTRQPRILTNMAFWQSDVWKQNTNSIYRVADFPTQSSASSFWIEALKLLARQSQYDVVVTMGARESLTYGLLCALIRRPSKQILCEVFIDTPQPHRLIWRWKTALYRFVAQKSLGVLTNSSSEVKSMADRFHVPLSKVRYVPMHSNIATPEASPQNDGYVLSAGRTYRDYDTLLKAASQVKAPLLIIAGRHDALPATLPDNVKALREISRKQYLDILRRCTVVALPLLPSERSTGQVVLLEAMAYGKPVVATRVPGTVDYIRHAENSLLVEPGNGNQLAAEINRLLGDIPLAQRLGHAAVEDVRSRYNFETHAKAKLEAIRDLWQSSSEPPRRESSR